MGTIGRKKQKFEFKFDVTYFHRVNLLIFSVAVGSSCSLHLNTGVLAGHYYELDPHWYAMLIK